MDVENETRMPESKMVGLRFNRCSWFEKDDEIPTGYFKLNGADVGYFLCQIQLSIEPFTTIEELGKAFRHSKRYLRICCQSLNKDEAYKAESSSGQIWLITQKGVDRLVEMLPNTAWYIPQLNEA